MIMAVICGYFVRWMKTWKVNNTIQTIMPILIIPILTSLVLGMAYIYILATPLGFVMDWLTSVLGSLQGGSAVVLGLVIGVMTAFDMGGPINKTASTFTMGHHGLRHLWPQRHVPRRRRHSPDRLWPRCAHRQE